MSRFVTDTHALYWHLSGDQRLSLSAQRIFQHADTGHYQVHIPGIVLVEMSYLVEKGRLDTTHVQHVFALLDVVHGSYTVAPLDQHVVRALQPISRSAIPDMPDRIIAATAR